MWYCCYFLLLLLLQTALCCHTLSQFLYFTLSALFYYITIVETCALIYKNHKTSYWFYVCVLSFLFLMSFRLHVLFSWPCLLLVPVFLLQLLSYQLELKNSMLTLNTASHMPSMMLQLVTTKNNMKPETEMLFLDK